MKTGEETELNTQKHQLPIIVGIITALAVVACSDSEWSPIRVPEGAQAGDLVMESCTIEIREISYKAEYGTLVVPENWDRTDSRLIALPVTRVFATGGESIEPIFWLEGGPGTSNMEFKPAAWLLANHDVIMVGYRGVDGSSVLDCPEVARAMRGVGSDLLGAESRVHLGTALSRCAGRLQAEGADLAGYTIPDVVADLEAARTGLGYRRVNLLSISYGTRIAQIYAYLYPESLHRLVMIGVNPPGHFVWEPETIDAQLEYYARLCAQDPECRMRTPMAPHIKT